MTSTTCPECESDNLSIKADKHGPQYFVCNDCGYSESAEHKNDLDEEMDEEEKPVKPAKKLTTKKVAKKPAKKGGKR